MRCMKCSSNDNVEQAPERFRLWLVAKPGRPERRNFRPWLCPECWKRVGLPQKQRRWYT